MIAKEQAADFVIDTSRKCALEDRDWRLYASGIMNRIISEKQRLLQVVYAVAVMAVALDSSRLCGLIKRLTILTQTMLEALRTMTIDLEFSRQFITLLSDRDNPASLNKAIDLILSLYPERDVEDVICQLQCVDENGRVVPHEETGLPTTIIKADWLAV